MFYQHYSTNSLYILISSATHSDSVLSLPQKPYASITALSLARCALRNSIGIVASSYKSAKLLSGYNARASSIPCAVFSIFALGCSTDDNNPVNPPAPPTPPTPQPEQPVADKVETQFTGNIALLADGSEQIVGFLQKRFTNMSTEVTDLTHAVLLNEKSSATILGDDAQLATVASLWERGGAAIFVNPGKSALQLVLKLNAVLVGSEPATITDEVAASFKDIVIMIVKADGDALLCNNIGSQKKVYNFPFLMGEGVWKGTWKIGQEITVLYDPNNPRISMIEGDISLQRHSRRYVIAGLLMVLVSAVAIAMFFC